MSNIHICRTCLQQITDFISINECTDLSSNTIIKHELTICAPELDLDVIVNAVVCTSCVIDLHAAYRFKMKCLQTEEKIQLYIDNSKLESTQFELNHLINGNNKDVTFVAVNAPLTLGNIKQEPSGASYDESYCESSFEENFIKGEPSNEASDVEEQKTDKKCEICGEEFTTNKQLRVHKKTHTSKAQYNCTQCEFSTNQNKELIRHVQTHTKDPVVVNVTSMKRKTFTIEDKVDLIRKLESGKKISEVSRETGLATSTVCCIWKSKETILKAFEKNGTHLKRLRKPRHADVDEALFIWFKEQNLGIPITGPLLKEKALELSRAMGNYDFACSGSWLDRFKARYNICFGKKKC